MRVLVGSCRIPRTCYFNKGIEVDPKKIEAIWNWEVPKNVT